MGDGWMTHETQTLLFVMQEPLQNVANEAYPKWLCAPCAKSRRGVLTQGRGDPQVKQLIAFMERNHPDKMRETYRAARIKPDGESIDIPGVQNLGESILAISSCFARYQRQTTFRHGLKNFADLENMSYKRFMAYQRWQCGEEKEDAQKIKLLA